MKPKGEKSARPRFHIVFLIDPERDADRYTALKQRLLAAFPFFDANAMDAARFLFGTEDPQVIYHPGTITLNAFLDDLENEQAFVNMGHTIPEGSRNSTMSRIGARIIKRYGDTLEAKELFLQAAGQCSPPLEERELESIWAGKQRLYAKMCNQPGYIPPDAYNSTGPVVWDRAESQASATLSVFKNLGRRFPAKTFSRTIVNKIDNIIYSLLRNCTKIETFRKEET